MASKKGAAPPKAGPGKLIFRAYRKANTPPSDPDLVVRESNNSFEISLGNVPLNLDDNKLDTTLSSGGMEWDFERIELAVDNALVCIPTVPSSGSSDYREDRIGINSKSYKYDLMNIGNTSYVLDLRCHSLCVVGGQHTIFGLKFRIYRRVDNSNDSSSKTYSTCFYSLEVGSATNTSSNTVLWSRLGDMLLGKYDPYGWGRLPHEDLNKTDSTPGPFIAKYDGGATFETSRTLEIKQVAVGPINSGLATLQLTYTSSQTESGYRILGVGPTDNSPRIIDLPTNGHGLTVAQRPSDEWVLGGKGPAWSLFVYSSLSTFWNKAVNRYRSSLKTARSVNRLTFLPMLNESAVNTSELGLMIKCSADISNPGPDVTSDQLKWTSVGAQPGLPNGVLDIPKQAYFDFGQSTPAFYNCIVSPVTHCQNVEAGSLAFGMALAGPLPQTGPARLGSLDLSFAGSLPSPLKDKSNCRSQFDSTFVLLDIVSNPSEVPRFGANLFLPVLTIAPAGQDSLPGSEYVPDNYAVLGHPSSDQCYEAGIERAFQGSAPVVISLGASTDVIGNAAPTSQSGYWAEITESNPTLYSQTVSVKLHVNPTSDSRTPPNNARQRVIVLDSDPFMVAEVLFDGFRPRSDGTSSDVVAIWSMDRVDGAAWELYTAAEPFSLVLPPQNLGEEMVKGEELQGYDDPNNLKPFDFRFSPPAVQTLEGSYTPQNYTEAPWNLRRILGFPGQRDAGAGVRQLQYELLYGLSCVAEVPMLRLAEIFSTIGRIVGRLPQQPATLEFVDGKAVPTTKDSVYGKYREHWAVLYGLYSKRVAVLEPRFSGANYGRTLGVQGASSTPEVVTLEAGVSCTFRSTASLYYGISPDVSTPDHDAVNENKFQIDPKGLKGGATYGFEEPRIYHATLRNPNSTTAKLVNPFFTAVGGSGFQKASFNGGLESVYSDTAIGRTFYYSIETMGRIGVYHNLARHVIEYERSTHVGPQFACTQPKFMGRPVLRKMREYIQILEPKAFLSAGATTYPECGCAKAIEFKSTVIPVDSSWGSNVGLIDPATGKPADSKASFGWKIPLWRRDGAGAAGTGACSEPAYVYTKPEIVFDLAGAAGADVECAIIDPEKLLFYTETKDNADSDPHKWPLVQGVDFSLSPVPCQNPPYTTGATTEIAAHDAPVPLGLSAFTLHLEPGHGTVDMVYGRATQAVGATLRSITIQKAVKYATLDVPQQIGTVGSQLRTDLFTAVRSDTTQAVTIAQGLTDAVNGLQKKLGDQVDQAKGQVVQQEKAFLKKWSDQVNNEVGLFASALPSEWPALISAASTPTQAELTAYKNALRDATENEVDALFARLAAVPVSANGLGRFCTSVNNAITAATAPHSQLDGYINAMIASLSAGSAAAQAQFDDFNASVNQVLDQLRSAVQSSIETWMPGAGLIVHAWESGVIGHLNSIKGYLNGNPDLNAAKAEVNKLEEPFGPILKALGPYLQYGNTVSTQLDHAHQLAHDAVFDAFQKWPDLPADTGGLEKMKAALVDTIRGLVNNQITGLNKQVSDTINDAVAKLNGLFTQYLDSAKDEVLGALGQFSGAASKAKDVLEGYRKQAEDAFGRYADSLLSNLPSQVDLKQFTAQLPTGDSVQAVLQRAFGAAPKVPNLDFSLPNVGYFYVPSLPEVNLTPLLSQVAGLGSALSPLGTALPSASMLERMIPLPDLSKFNLSSIFPNFAGLDLSSLFAGLNMPADAGKYIKITHGVDASSKSAWVNAEIDFSTDAMATLFSIGPITLQLPKATFQAHVKMQADIKGQVVKQTTGSITGDWNLVVSGMTLITLQETSLSFDEQGHVHFNVSPAKVQLAAALSFIEDFIASYSSPDSGFSILPSLTGIQTRLTLPIPNTSAGTTGITNLTFGFNFGLEFVPFAITTGFSLGRAQAPFNISIFILGGGGYVETSVRFEPGKGISCTVDIELAASASLAIAFGPISGYVAIFVGMSVQFKTGGGSDLRLGIFILVVGEVSILSLVSAYVSLRLEATYGNGVFTGRGTFSIRIKICWCFTLEVSESVQFTIGSSNGGGGNGGMALNEPPVIFPTFGPVSDVPSNDLPLAAEDVPNFAETAKLYINMIS